jgi:hypothetical protein
MTMEDRQSREMTGAQQRSGHVADVVAVIRSANLKPAQRTAVLEHLEMAISADHREELGGARHLSGASKDPATPYRLTAALEALASRFVRPS